MTTAHFTQRVLPGGRSTGRRRRTSLPDSQRRRFAPSTTCFTGPCNWRWARGPGPLAPPSSAPLTSPRPAPRSATASVAFTTYRTLTRRRCRCEAGSGHLRLTTPSTPTWPPRAPSSTRRGRSRPSRPAANSPRRKRSLYDVTLATEGHFFYLLTKWMP